MSRPLNVLIAPDKFKGTLTARQAAEAMAEGVRRARPDAAVDLCPMSDGGDGFVDVLAGPIDATRVTRTVTGPLPGMRVDATFAVAGDLAIIEFAAASGLALLNQADRDPTRTTSYGTGELVRHAVAMDCRRVLIGLGGSATVDGGLGLLQAMGHRVTLGDAPHGATTAPLTGGDLPRVVGVGRGGPCDGLEVRAACDVTTPVAEAAATFGPQKGATPTQVRHLTAGLRHLARVLRQPERQPRTGAAGGAGLALLAVGGELLAGVELVAEALGVADSVRRADLVLTGEGCCDATSFDGKVVGHLLRLAGATPTCVIAGRVTPDAARVLGERGHALVDGPADPAGALTAAAERAVLDLDAVG